MECECLREERIVARCFLYQRRSSPAKQHLISHQHIFASPPLYFFTMVATLSALFTILPLTAAWPAVMHMNEQMQKREEPPSRAPLFKSGRQNTGLPALGFNARDQFVNVTRGSGHEFASPGNGDIRGQCPGLNAAANHGFIPRNGLLTTQQTVNGLRDAYNMAPDLALFLAVVSIALAGDPVSGRWSIGGSFTPTLPLFPATGIAGTHNAYEGDASIVRGDAYLNDGRVGVFQMRSWEHLYQLAEEYTLDDIAAQSDYVTRWSIANNPYYFSAPFSGLVAPAAHNFVINFMSNHSAEKPGGTLTRNVLKQFFAVTGDSPGNFVHNRGQERIPENWYRRPTANAMTIPQVLTDVQVNNAVSDPPMINICTRLTQNRCTQASFALVVTPAESTPSLASMSPISPVEHSTPLVSLRATRQRASCFRHPLQACPMSLAHFSVPSDRSSAGRHSNSAHCRRSSVAVSWPTSTTASSMAFLVLRSRPVVLSTRNFRSSRVRFRAEEESG